MDASTQAILAELRQRDTDPAYADAPVLDGYARISINRGTGETEKTDRQIGDILRAIQSRRARLGMIHRDDNLSAWKLNGKRPGWVELVRRIETGETDGVQVWRTDRLLRQPRDLENLLDRAKNGSKIFAVDGEYDLGREHSQLTLRIKVAVAYEESLNNSLRQKRKQAALREAGKAHGGPRAMGEYGAGVSDDVVALEREAIADGVRQMLAGATLAQVAEDWTSRGLRRRGTKPINYAKVKDILTQPRIAGLIVIEGTVVSRRTDSEPIVPEAEFNRLQTLFTSRASKGRPYSRGAALTGGILTCGACGHALSSKMNPRGSYTQHQYICSPNGGCGRVSIDAKSVEALVRDATCKALGSPQAAAWGAQVASRVAEAAGALSVAEHALTDLAARYSRKELTLDEWLILRPALGAEVERTRQDLEDMQANMAAVELSGAPDTSDVAFERWDSGNLDERRRMVRAARLRIVIRSATFPREAASARIDITAKD